MQKSVFHFFLIGIHRGSTTRQKESTILGRVIAIFRVFPLGLDDLLEPPFSTPTNDDP